MVRSIKREEKEETPAAPEAQVPEVKEETPAVPAPDKPKAPKALSVELTLKDQVCIFSLRVIGNIVIFNDGSNMRRQTIVRGKPITVTMKQ